MQRDATPDNRSESERLVAALERLSERLPERVRRDVPLRDFTTFRIGGPARAFGSLLNAGDARRFLEIAGELAVPTVCLGGGSNVLADDAGFAGLVLHMAADDFAAHGTTVRVGAGHGFDALVERTLQDGLTGLEFASGIPGSLGGAVVGNAGCYGHEIAEFVVEAEVLRPDGRIETLGREDFGFAYRHSQLKDRPALILEVTLHLARGDVSAAGDERRRLLADRWSKHPTTEPCAGSFFKNLPPLEPGGRRRPAGALLEAVGAKSMRVGAAGVYPKHANIIVNLGNARSADVLTLAGRMQDAVAERFDTRLEPEVRHLPPSGAPWGILG